MTNTTTSDSKFEFVHIMVGISGAAVHGGTRVDGELLPFPHCGARAVHIAAETSAPITCAKCASRAAKAGR